MSSNSKMQKTPVLVSIGGRNDRSSGLFLQNLIFAIVSLLWPSCICLNSSRVRGWSISWSLTVFHIESSVTDSMIFNHWRSSSNSCDSLFQIVCKFFSPVIQMHLQLLESNLTSSPWITRQNLVYTLMEGGRLVVTEPSGLQRLDCLGVSNVQRTDSCSVWRCTGSDILALTGVCHSPSHQECQRTAGQSVVSLNDNKRRHHTYTYTDSHQLQVLSLLALIVQIYKYWHLRRCVSGHLNLISMFHHRQMSRDET